MKMQWWSLLAALAVGSIAGCDSQTLCEDWTYENVDSRNAVLAYCKRPGTSVATGGQLQCFVQVFGLDDYRIVCKCNSGYTMPDCSLALPDKDSGLDDATNSTPNTCWVEDLLQVHQAKNDFTKYGHYVTKA